MHLKKHLVFCLFCGVVCLSMRFVAMQQYPSPVKDAQRGETTVVSFAEYSKIDLNTASKEQLCLLSGIGEAKADAIIEHRTMVAPFETVEDVASVSGVTVRMIEEWGDSVYVSSVNG